MSNTILFPPVNPPPAQAAPPPVAPPPPAPAEPVPQAAAVPAAPDQTPKPDGVPATLVPQAKGESDRAFEAFRAYLELGPKRRYAAVAKIVGTCLRTVQRWARDFAWRERIKTYAAQSAEHYAETERTARCEEILDAAAHAKAIRARRYALGEAILDAAERYLEGVEDDYLDQMNFGDACKALAVTLRLGQKADDREANETSAPGPSLHDQISALLDQIYPDAPSGNGAGGHPSPAIPTKPQP